MKDIINNIKKSDIWKIQLTIAINFVSFKGYDEEHEMHSKSDNIQIMIYDIADEVIEEIFGSSSNRFQIGFEILMRVRDSVFDYVNLLHCKCYKINFEDGGSYIDSLDWIKSKKQQ